MSMRKRKAKLKENSEESGLAGGEKGKKGETEKPEKENPPFMGLV